MSHSRQSAGSGFTLTEILIVSVVFSLFLFGLFSLFSSGQKIGGQAFWLQRTINELRNTGKHISGVMKRSSYPSTIVFPGRIFENITADFGVHISGRGTLFATQSATISGKSAPGTRFLRFVESAAEKQNFTAGTNQNAKLGWHIYSLTSDGRLLYHHYQETIPTTDPTGPYIQSLTRATIPPPAATLESSSELIGGVESITISGEAIASVAPILIDITCHYARGHTRRSERVAAMPNVQTVIHNVSDPNW